MVVLLLVFLAATVATGLVIYGGEQQSGPLAGMFTEATGEAVEEWHEVIANITLGLIFIHIAASSRKFRKPRKSGPGHGDWLQAALALRATPCRVFFVQWPRRSFPRRLTAWSTIWATRWSAGMIRSMRSTPTPA